MQGQKSKNSSANPRYAFGFLDETGGLQTTRDPFFAVGLLRCREPYELLRPMQRIRDRQHFYDEIKWNKVSAKKLPILIDLLNVFFSADATFSAFIVDKQKHDVVERFGGLFNAYDALARQLVRGSIKRGETLWIVADEYSTPPMVTFEENVRDYVNQRLKRSAVAGVCRMRSSGVDLLQLVDLILGAAVYERKVAMGIASYKPKLQLLEHLKRRAGVGTFCQPVFDDRFNIREYGAVRARSQPAAAS